MGEKQAPGTTSTASAAARRWLRPMVLILLIVLLLRVAFDLTLFNLLNPWLPRLAALFVVVILAAMGLGITLIPARFASWFWGISVFLALVLYVVALYYQAGAPDRTERYQHLAHGDFTAYKQTVGLTVVYPGIIPLEAPDKPGLPLSVYMWPPVMAAVTATANSGTTPTATAPVSYTVAFQPNNEGVLFTDKEGSPVSPHISLRLDEPSQPAHLYLRRALVATAYPSTTIAVDVYDPNGRATEVTTLPVVLEDVYASWWRHFKDLAFGPTTPLLALGIAIVGFVWQWSQQAREEANTRRKAVYMANLDEIERVSHVDPAGARQQLKSLRESARPDLGDAELRKRLDDVRGAIDKNEKDQQTLQQEIDAVLEDAPTDPVTATHRWNELRRRAEQEHWGGDATRRLEDGRARLVALPEWQRQMPRAILAQINDGQMAAAEDNLKLMQTLQPASPDVLDLERLLKLLGGQEDQHLWWQQVEKLGLVALMASLFSTFSKYDDAARRPVAQVLAKLIRRPEGREELRHQLELPGENVASFKALARQPELQTVLGQVRANTDLSEEDRLFAFTYLAPFSRWLQLWPAERPDEDARVVPYLRDLGLMFNPFGPDVAERDPLLPSYVVPTPFEAGRGRRPALVLGKAGTGRTAAALTLAFGCDDPLLKPREPHAFPVYYTPPLDIPAREADLAQLQALARATADWLIKFLAVRPNGFLQLPQLQRKLLAYALLVNLDSLDHVIFALHQAGLEEETELIPELSRLHVRAPHRSQLNVSEWLALLAHARPYGYDCLYALADLPTSTLNASDNLSAAVQSLFRLMTPLAVHSVYLKIFMPIKTEPPSDIPACTVVQLRWTKEDLQGMLKARIEAAAGQEVHFRQLFQTSAEPHPDARLIDAAMQANDPPRRLIRLGNALLSAYVRRRQADPQSTTGNRLASEDLDEALTRGVH
ncbi:MAG: hypothetical protein U0768_09000 [Anaerolineae bacterium]